MIVSKQNAGTVTPGGVGDDCLQRKVRAGFVADVARNVEAPRLFIDMGHPQAFPIRVAIGDATGEKLTRGGKAIELQRKFGTLISHANKLGAAAVRSYRNRIRNGAISD